MGDEAVGVEFAALPAEELLQIDVELRLKDSDCDGPGPDPATDIRQKIVGVVERNSDAVAVEIGPQPTPIAGQGSGRGGGRRLRPLALRQGGRAAIPSPASQEQRSSSERPCPTTSSDPAHLLRPRSHLRARFRCDSGKMLWRNDRCRVGCGEVSMLEGVMLLWFVLTAAALLFVAVDIRTTPESPVLKWGFVLLTAYTGVIGAFLYVLGCREPLPGLHERYVAVRWRQTLGSTMHCVAGDGVGILAGAVLSSVFGLAGLAEIILEYVLGFAFGWTIFQALFMRDMAGGSYLRALTSTF